MDFLITADKNQQQTRNPGVTSQTERYFGCKSIV